jgi:hypothetical protein
LCTNMMPCVEKFHLWLHVTRCSQTGATKNVCSYLQVICIRLTWTWILCSDLGSIPKISHAYTNIPKSETIFRPNHLGQEHSTCNTKQLPTCSSK